MSVMPRKRVRQRIYLKEWRKHRQLSQEALASRMEIDRTVLSKLENGLLDYHQAHLENAAAALGCTPADLIVRDPSQQEPIWSIWDTIPDNDKPTAIAVLKALKKPDSKAS